MTHNIREERQTYHGELKHRQVGVVAATGELEHLVVLAHVHERELAVGALDDDAHVVLEDVEGDHGARVVVDKLLGTSLGAEVPDPQRAVPRAVQDRLALISRT